MRRLIHRRSLRRSLILAGLMLGAGIAPAQPLPARTSEQSAVTVKVTPLELGDTAWRFQVTFDTHSQALEDDLPKTAVLLAADGTAIAPVAWQGDPPGGHHRQGELRFPAPKPRPAVIELRIGRPGEAAPRVFRWD